VPAETMARWLALSRRQPMEGGHELGTSAFETGLGKGYARAVPVRLRAEGQPGAFVVAGLPVGEREEIRRLQSYAFAVTSGVLLIGSLAAWFVAGRVLGPIRLLTQTALAISESDLTRRIQARGKDELADMGRAFNAMLDRLEAAFRSQRGFVRDASHELRDPLTVSRGHLELIGGTPDEQRETIALVIDEIDRMARTVDELQLLAEAEHPDFLRPGSTDLGHFTHELAAKAGALAPREWNVETAAEGTLDGDRHRLTEAVLNLAHNAVQQTRPGDAIAIGTSRSSDEVRIWLRDSGPGVPLADHARIFRRFERGSSGSTAYRGSGLGLSIVKAIAEAHGGRVELDSRPGDGATFTIVVPANEEQRGDGQDPDR
jgi:two-component system OmpR family sensor kinase